MLPKEEVTADPSAQAPIADAVVAAAVTAPPLTLTLTLTITITLTLTLTLTLTTDGLNAVFAVGRHVVKFYTHYVGLDNGR